MDRRVIFDAPINYRVGHVTLVSHFRYDCPHAPGLELDQVSIHLHLAPNSTVSSLYSVFVRTDSVILPQVSGGHAVVDDSVI